MVQPTFSTRAVAALLLAILFAPRAMAQSSEIEFAEWPREIETAKGTIVIYQPQPESFQGDHLESRAAVSVQPAGANQPVFGAMWFRARVETNMEARALLCVEVEVIASKFPDADETKVARLERYLESEMPKWDLWISLDQLLATLEENGVADAAAMEIQNAPPEIVVRDHAAVLVLIDGQPRLEDLQDTGLKYVVNTPYFIVQEADRFYLKGGPQWYEAADIQGNWEPTEELPAKVADIARQIEEREKEEAERSAQEKASQEQSGDGSTEAVPDVPETPEIIVRTAPAELIQTDGKPEYAAVEGTQLLYVKNSESDLLMDIASQQHFLLITGRWYRSESLANGPWTYVSADELPAEFAQIPEGSDMEAVLPSVAGTEQAREALLENQIPQTAEVDRKTATCTVTYDGDPQFERCSDNVAHAKNTDKTVLLIDDRYYCCDNAVWFVSEAPMGPWNVATEVPAQVQEIPPDCPAYNVKYVYIYDSTPDVVYVGYTPGYMGSYVYGPTVVYGTGFYYQPWYGHYYYPRPVTYGFSVHYNPYTGWGCSFGVSYGWLHVSFSSWSRPPYYGAYWGPAGYRAGYRHGYWHGYHHGYRRGFDQGYRYGARAGYRAGYRAGQGTTNPNLYRNRADGVRRTAPVPRTRPQGDIARRPSTGTGGRPSTQPARPGTSIDRSRPTTMDRQVPQAAKRPNNVYTDRQGNVHRRENDQWQTRQNGQWKPQDRSSTQRPNLERQHQSRQRGNAQTRQSAQVRRAPSRGRRR